MILIDASIAPGVARELGEARGDVLSVADIYPSGTQDPVWLMEAGVNGWLVITRDKRIVRRPAESAAPARTAPIRRSRARQRIDRIAFPPARRGMIAPSCSF